MDSVLHVFYRNDATDGAAADRSIDRPSPRGRERERLTRGGARESETQIAVRAGRS